MFPMFLPRLKEWVRSQPDKTAWSFCDDNGNVNDTFTYAELDQSTTALAHHLLSSQCGLKVGDRVMLVFFPGLHFTASLIACFKAGIIGVPVFPPDPTRLKKDLNHFVSIQSSSSATVVLTHGSYNYAKKIAGVANIFSSSGDKWPNMKWIQIDDILNKSKQSSPHVSPPSSLPEIKGSDIAFLQYTSGSTSEPKGVMITHSNLGHNLTLIIRELKADTATVNVSWLPQYHDMGLIGSYLGAVYCGGTGYYISPISFLKNPLVWMNSMSKFSATHTQAPNFAYALSARKYKEAKKMTPSLPSLELGCVQHMINAAEPVDAIAMADFLGVYGPMGLRSHVIVPTYGLAEHTVFVASGGETILSVVRSALEADQVVIEQTAKISTPQGVALCKESSPIVQNIIGCGIPSRGEGVQLLIVDPTTSAVQPEDRVGEIWLNSPSKAQGYWDKLEQSEQEFQAKVAGSDANSPGYLRTGDLGFMHQGELFICGRIKDMIIVRGSNHYPQDIERTAERTEVAYLRAGCSAAFAIDGASGSHTEGVALLVELKDNVSKSKLHSIAESCKLAISKEHGLSLSCICLLPARSIPKTTSGKITRAGSKKQFFAGTLSILYRIDGSPDTPATAGGNGSLAHTHDDVVDPSQLELPTWIESDSGPDVESYSLMNMPEVTQEQVRAMSIDEIQSRLEMLLLDVASHGPSPLSKPIDPEAALVALGLDSMSIVQFKGALENTLHCFIPDEYMFTSLATLSNFAIAAQHGTLTEKQRKELEDGSAPLPGQGTSTISLKDEPCCPWYIGCC